VGYRHLAQCGLGLAQLDELLELGLGQVLALEQAQHAGVGSRLVRGAGADGHGDLAHGSAV
jgi:hypothetical protein